MSYAAELPWYVTAGMAVDARARRFEEVFDAHYDRVWRTLRRLGVADADADDAAQRVFLVAARRLDEIRVGEEAPWLYGVALRTASETRRRDPARRTVADAHGVETIADSAEGAEGLLIAYEARAALDDALAGMPEDLRQILVLVELEGLSVRGVSEVLEVAQGTAASRLRRAREAFSESARRVRVRMTKGAP